MVSIYAEQAVIEQEFGELMWNRNKSSPKPDLCTQHRSLSGPGFLALCWHPECIHRRKHGHLHARVHAMAGWHCEQGPGRAKLSHPSGHPLLFTSKQPELCWLSLALSPDSPRAQVLP